MDHSSDKKRRERFFLDRFLERIGIAPTRIEDWEGPDFLLHLEDRILGVEVTHLHIRDSSPGPLAQAVESVTDGIVSDAYELYKDSCATPALVTVLFGSNFNPKAIRRDMITKELVSIIQGMNLSPGERGEWRSWDEENWEHPISGSVDHLYAWAVPDPDMARWRVSRAGWVSLLTPERLQSPISKKSSKIGAYQEVVQENWLLIVADSMKPSQAFSIPPDFESDQVSSPFAKTFFYKYPDGEVIEVCTQPTEP